MSDHHKKEYMGLLDQSSDDVDYATEMSPLTPDHQLNDKVGIENTTLAQNEYGKCGTDNSDNLATKGNSAIGDIPVIPVDFGTSGPIDLHEICRCCLSKRKDLQAIFENNSCIPEMIMALATVQISSDEELPTNICMQCVLHVSRAVSFKQLIEAADETLRQYVSQAIVHIDETLNNSTEAFPPSDNENDTHSIDSNLASEQCINANEYEGEYNVEKLGTDENSHSDTVEPIIDQNEALNPESTMHRLQENENEENVFYGNHETFTETTTFDDVEFVDDHHLSNSSENETALEHEVTIQVDFAETITGSASVNKPKPKLKSKPQVHKIVSTKTPTEWSCYICKKNFPNHRKLSRHKKIHEDEKPFKCATCQKGFHERADLKRHILRHNRIDEESSTEFRMRCTECHMGFNVERDLLIHRSVHSIENGKFDCGECGKEFSTNVQLKRHVRIHYQEKPHKCSLCNKGFPEKGSLTRHFRRHTGEEREKKHLCTLCGKKYFDSHSLNVHSRTHTGEKPWSCTVCGKCFIDSRLLYSHSKVHSPLKPYECSYCDKRFTHQSTLTSHVRTHTGEKPYVCSVCGKSFIQSSNLSLHMRVHSGEKPFKCSMCDRTFASSSTLRMHNRIHTGEKPYSCSVCFKTFARRDMSAHMRTHTGEKPYNCTSCTKRFTTSGQLSQHIRTHTGEKPYVCNICFKACSSSTYQKKHQKAHAINNDVPKELPIRNTMSADHGGAQVLDIGMADVISVTDDQNLIEIANTYLVHEQPPHHTHSVITIGPHDDKLNEFHDNHDALLSAVNANDLIHIDADHETSIRCITTAVNANGVISLESGSALAVTHGLDGDKPMYQTIVSSLMRNQQNH